MDTLIGVLWAVGMAAGIILIDLSPGYNVDLMSFLFGSILAVPATDIRLMAAMDGIIVMTVCYFYKDILSMCYDLEFSMVRGVPVRFLHFLLLALIAIAVVMTIRVVGLILVMALFTIAPYLAEGKASSLKGMMLISVMANLAFVLAGLSLACKFNLTSGATIILVAALFFVLITLGEKVLSSKPKGGHE